MSAIDTFLKDFKGLIIDIVDAIAKIQTIPTGTAVFLAGLLIAVVLLYGETKNRWEWKFFPYHGGRFFIGITFFLQLIIDCRSFRYDGDLSLLVAALALLIYCFLIFIAIIIARILLTDIFLRLINANVF